MGYIDLSCVTLNGSRLVGMAYTLPTSAYNQNLGYNDRDKYSHVILIQSNENPSDHENLSWSLVSSWPRLPAYNTDVYSSFDCHIGQSTGTFSLMSNFSVDTLPVLVTSIYRPPGGFQYNPKTGKWSDFSINPDYLWANVSATFALFNWPGSSSLYQANIGSITDGTINIGMLDDSTPTSKFINIANYTLDPNVYGYPMKLVYANDSIYQLGSVVVDKRTAEISYFLTRIPLQTKNNSPSLDIPANLPVYNASILMGCEMRLTKIWFSSFFNSVYFICQSYINSYPLDSRRGHTITKIFQFKDGDKTIKESNITGSPFSSTIFQPLENKEINYPWIYMTGYYAQQDGIQLRSNGIFPFPYPGNHVFISEAFGADSVSPTSYEFSTGNTPAITAGIVLGFLFLLAIVFYGCFWRRRTVWRKKWFRFKTRTGPRWLRRVRLKLVDILKEDLQIENDNDSDKDDKKSHINGKTVISREDENEFNNKIDERSNSSFELRGCDKILITDDMDLSERDCSLTVDVAAGYMKSVGLESHPRPAVVTSLATISDSNDSPASSTVYNGSSESLGLMIPSAPLMPIDAEDIPNA
ncbi:hypothetical protein FBU30_004945 [Linnemannia zychae]|nr:hypothetical protein FBU30_004945 [Linnemannia zychae]